MSLIRYVNLIWLPINKKAPQMQGCEAHSLLVDCKGNYKVYLGSAVRGSLVHQYHLQLYKMGVHRNYKNTTNDMPKPKRITPYQKSTFSKAND